MQRQVVIVNPNKLDSTSRSTTKALTRGGVHTPVLELFSFSRRVRQLDFHKQVPGENYALRRAN